MKRLVLLLFFISYSLYFSAQQHKVDSLYHVLKTAKEDTNKVKVLNNLSRILYSMGSYTQSDSFAKIALQGAERLNYKPGLSTAYRNIGNVYWSLGNLPEALKNQMQCLKIDTEMGYMQSMGFDYGNIGNIYYQQGNYPAALQYQLQSLKIDQQTDNKEDIPYAYLSIGNLYLSQKNYDEAIKNEKLALVKFKEQANLQEEGSCYMNIGAIYGTQGNIDEALKNYLQSLEIEIRTNNKPGLSACYVNIGMIYALRDSTDKALEYFYKSLGVSRIINNRQGMASAYEYLGSMFAKGKKYTQAKMYLDSALQLSSEIAEKNIMQQTYFDRCKLDSSMGDNKAAFADYKMYIIYRDSLNNEENTKKIVSEQMTYDFEQKQAAQKAEQDKKDALATADKKRQHIITMSVSAGLIVVLLFSGLLFSRFRITQRQKRVIEEQKLLVEEKNKEVLDSITYAKRLQDAILPPLNAIEKALPESFVLYNPKDIVAGDFYWMERVGDTILIAAADCTGHGVPGAMVSVVCSNALNRAVKEFGIRETGKILDKVRELVLETFEKSQSEVKDGMDISLVAISHKLPANGSSIQWAGAYNPLWYLQGGLLKEVAPDKQPIGMQDNPKPFTTHHINLQKGDILYLFTDGYADQFGGPKGKKFKYKQLQELLLTNAGKAMDEQKKILDEALRNWKGQMEQTDDVCIIGIRV